MKKADVIIIGLVGIEPVDPNEKWKFCTVSNSYLVSNMGRIFSLKQNKLMKPYKDVYYKVTLQLENKKSKTYYVHRLVALAWIPNPNLYPEVNHKKEFEKLNNCVDNLEWCDRTYNNNYGTKNRRASIRKQKPVCQYNEEFNLIKIWNGKVDIMKELGYCDKTIGYHCRTNNHLYDGYYWYYADDINNKRQKLKEINNSE